LTKINLLEAFLKGRTTTKQGKRIHASLKRWKGHWNITLPPKREKAERKAANARVKAEAIAAYGGGCRRCGEKDHACLTIDHIKNDGAVERAKGIRGGGPMYLWLRRFGYPTDNYQLLCWNCQWKKRVYEQLV